jgi:hypothetical protein
LGLEIGQTYRYRVRRVDANGTNMIRWGSAVHALMFLSF